MPTFYGRDIARQALKEIGVLDAVETGGDEIIADALIVGSNMVDEWRTQNLTVPSVTRSQYPLVSGTANYTIGPGGTFAQDYPTAIEQWSVIPIRAATYPNEISMGRPYTFDQWQSVRIKSQQGPYPVRMYFDNASDVNYRGTVSFHPVPNVTTVDVVLYQLVPILTQLVAGTQYALRPGYANAIILNLAYEIADRQGRDMPPRLEKRAGRALGNIKRAARNRRNLESSIRAEFIIGSGTGRRTFNIYTGGR